MRNDITAIKTDEALLNKLRSAPPPSAADIRKQRVSFAIGMLGRHNTMTREQVRQIIERRD